MEYVYPVRDTKAVKFTVQAGVGFLDPGYYAARKMEHPGSDFNATTGGDSDLGMPVYCISDGVIKDVGFYRGWGWIVLIWHPLDKIWSQYAHLRIKPLVVKGQQIAAGRQLGEIGKGDKGQFFAHLHFEIRSKAVPSWYWPANSRTRAQSQVFIRSNYLDPVKWLQQKKATKVW
jgi:murein DD-endopeptidase MepM/ murein hydrolase activator NlpD